MRVAAGLQALAADLSAELGPVFDVTVGPVCDTDVGVTTAAGRVATAFIRAQHPRAILIVVDRGYSGHDDAIADYLCAGADQYLDTTCPRLLGAHIRALTRRSS